MDKKTKIIVIIFTLLFVALTAAAVAYIYLEGDAGKLMAYGASWEGSYEADDVSDSSPLASSGLLATATSGWSNAWGFGKLAGDGSSEDTGLTSAGGSGSQDIADAVASGEDSQEALAEAEEQAFLDSLDLQEILAEYDAIVFLRGDALGEDDVDALEAGGIKAYLGQTLAEANQVRVDYYVEYWLHVELEAETDGVWWNVYYQDAYYIPDYDSLSLAEDVASRLTSGTVQLLKTEEYELLDATMPAIVVECHITQTAKKRTEEAMEQEEAIVEEGAAAIVETLIDIYAN